MPALFPAIPFYIGVVFLKSPEFIERVWLLISSTILACFVFAILILFIGIPLHLSMGGKW